jgi:hypothetical protein
MLASQRFRHQDIRLAETVRIRDNANNGEAETLIEPEWVATQIPDRGKMRERCGEEFDPGKRRLVNLIIGAEEEGQSAACACACFERGNECAPDPTPLPRRIDDERVEFPDVPVILCLAADPAAHATIGIAGDQTESPYCAGGEHFFPRGWQIGPGIRGLCPESGDEYHGRLLDPGGIIGAQLGDLHCTLPRYVHHTVARL